MRIAMIVPALVTGGAETMAVRLSLAIDKTNYQLKVFVLGKNSNSNLDNMLSENGIDVEYISGGKWNRLFTLFRGLTKYRPSVIHSHIAATIYALPWLLIHNAKGVHTVHTRPDAEFSGKTLKLIKFVIKKDKLVICAVSKENQRIATDFYKVPDNKVFFVNNPVDIKHYYKNDNDDGNIRIINVSRQDVNKNQILILKAIKTMSLEFENLKLILVGDGNQHENLKRFCKENKIIDRVEFTGQIADARNYLAEADIYVSASHREGLPLSMIEAMAAKLPIVSSKVGGVPDLVDQNGYLYEDDNLEQLVFYLKKLCLDKELRNKMGDRSFEIVQEFDAEKCARKYESIYTSIAR